MRTVLRTNDLVLLSLAEAVLRDAGMDPQVFDSYAASVDGSIGAVPRRLVVPERHGEEAETLVAALQAEADGAGGPWGRSAS